MHNLNNSDEILIFLFSCINNLQLQKKVNRSGVSNSLLVGHVNDKIYNTICKVRCSSNVLECSVILTKLYGKRCSGCCIR
jgi:hypothetical protein